MADPVFLSLSSVPQPIAQAIDKTIAEEAKKTGATSVQIEVARFSHANTGDTYVALIKESITSKNLFGAERTKVVKADFFAFTSTGQPDWSYNAAFKATAKDFPRETELTCKGGGVYTFVTAYKVPKSEIACPRYPDPRGQFSMLLSK